MELFGIEGTEESQYMFSEASQNGLCMSGGCGSKGRRVILEDLRVALWPSIGDATNL